MGSLARTRLPMPSVQRPDVPIEPALLLSEERQLQDGPRDPAAQLGFDGDGGAPTFAAPSPQPQPAPDEPVNRAVAGDSLIEEQTVLAGPSADRSRELTLSAPPLPPRKPPSGPCMGPVVLGCLVCFMLAFGLTMTQLTCVDKCGEFGSCGGFACRCDDPYVGEHCDSWPNGTSVHAG